MKSSEIKTIDDLHQWLDGFDDSFRFHANGTRMSIGYRILRMQAKRLRIRNHKCRLILAAQLRAEAAELEKPLTNKYDTDSVVIDSRQLVGDSHA